MIKYEFTENIFLLITTIALLMLSHNIKAIPLSESALVIGKVFHDKNGDGFQNSQEEGIPGVRLATVSGLIIETDGYGRFHIQRTQSNMKNRGRNFIIKLDKQSMPHGAQLTTENPRVIPNVNMAFKKIVFGLQF